jgi:hypothetical protein
MITTSEISFPGYICYRLDRSYGRGGGILIFSKTQLNTNIENSISCRELKLLHITLQPNHSKPINFVACYRPPSSNASSSLAVLSNFLNNINYIDFPLVILGDLNINILKKTPDSRRLRELNKSYNLCFLNESLPTRTTISTRSNIDVVFHNQQATAFLSHFTIDPCCFSDHDLLLFTYKKIKIFKDTSHKYITIRNTSDYYLNIFQTKINDSNVPFDNFDSFNKFLLDTFHSVFPTKKIRIKPNQAIWITPHFVKLAHYRDRLYRASRRNSNASTYAAWKALRNYLVTYSKNLKKNFYHSSFDRLENNPRKSWRLLKTLVGNSNSCSQPTSLSIGGNIIIDPSVICTEFNHYFTNNCHRPIVTQLSNSAAYIPHASNTQFSIVPVHVSTVTKAVLSLKKTSIGPNSIPCYILRHIYAKVAEKITPLINNSFTSSNFPSSLKVAKVTPIFKKGGKDDMSNYRPISVLPTLSKVPEKIVALQITSFLDNLGLFSDAQHGFRAHHSTATALTQISDYIFEGFTRSEFTLALFIDFSKAFDSISHDILLNKLSHLHFSPNSLSWVKSYLSDRTQYVSVQNCASSLANITCGVPQGSILGPLLFILLINDLPKCLKDSIAVIYADDTTLLIRGKCWKSLVKKINSDLLLLSNYCTANSLSINVSKTKAMFFFRKTNKPQNANILYNGYSIEMVDSFKLLGIWLDTGLDFHIHISHIVNKLNVCLHLLWKCRAFIPYSKLILLFNAFGIPYIDYCQPVYTNSTDLLLKPLITKYDECCKAIIGHGKYSSSSTAHSHLNIPSFTNRLYYNKAIFIFKAKLGLSSNYLSNAFMSANHTHLTRYSTSNFFLSHCHSELSKRIFYVYAPRFWATLSPNLKSCSSVHSFKHNLSNL